MTFVVEPKDTLVLRDGRPMDGPVHARTLGFPWPSSVVGLVRSHMNGGHAGTWNDAKRQELMSSISLRGPWLVRLDEQGKVLDSYFPAPRDAVWFDQDDGSVVRCHVEPVSLADGELSDLAEQELVGLVSDERGKASRKAPAFWSAKSILEWLEKPTDGKVKPADVGIPALPRETRTHVALAEDSRTARDGMLFMTEHLRFHDKTARYALAFDADGAEKLADGIVVLGGERRPSRLRRVGPSALACPAIPKDARRLRVVLVTPGIFAEGAAPATIHGARVFAAAVDRPEVCSGWDYATNKPKPTRRMAQAGSVYWVELPQGKDAQEWTKEVWMRAISSDQQDCRDGFGLALVGRAK